MKKAKRLFYLPVYVDRLYGSASWQMFCNDQKLLLLLLLIGAWRGKPPGYLPNDDEELRRICYFPRKALWDRKKGLVLKRCFETTEDQQFLFNQVLLDILEEKGYLEKINHERAKKGADGRWNRNASRMLGGRSDDASQSNLQSHNSEAEEPLETGATPLPPSEGGNELSFSFGEKHWAEMKLDLKGALDPNSYDTFFRDAVFSHFQSSIMHVLVKNNGAKLGFEKFRKRLVAMLPEGILEIKALVTAVPEHEEERP